MKKIVSLMLALVLCLVLSVPAFAEMIQEASNEEYAIDTPYEFPVAPGTEEWAALKTFDEKLAVSQIPDEILGDMTNDALIRTVINYPLSASLFVHDTPDDPLRSYNVVKEEFNGLAELDQRLDNNPEEVIMAMNSVMNSMPAPTSEDVEDTDDFDLLCMEKLTGVFSNIEPVATRSFIEVQLATGDPNITVPAYYNLTWSDLGETSENVTKVNNKLLQEYPSATRIRNSASQYNCHSYAWYSISADNKYWINDPSNYYEAGDYVKSTTPNFMDIIVYGRVGNSPDHSGKVTRLSNGVVTRVESKWGYYGLFEHDLGDCPYSTRTLEYYR